MKKLHFKSWSLIALVLLFVSGCSSSTIKAEEEIKIAEPVDLFLAEVMYDSKDDLFKVMFKTNIDAGIEVTADLYSPVDQSLIGHATHKLTNDHEGEYDLIEFENVGFPEFEINGTDVRLGVEIEVEEDTEKNTDFYNSVVGGYGDDLSEQYKYSEDVTIVKEESNGIFNYTVEIESNVYTMKHTMPKANITEEIEKNKNISYSTDFINYNTKYYTNFRNQMDLVASNFEILAMDGFVNQDIVDDLITWTSEFNEVLKVYKTDSIPVNEMDQELHDHTIEMIIEQRLVNENIINGLTENDETYFFTAGDHLENVTDMYLEGYDLLNY